MQRLLQYGKTYRNLIWQAVTWSVINKIFDLAPPVLIGAAVDVVVNQQDSFIGKLGVNDVFNQLLILSFFSKLLISISISAKLYSTIFLLFSITLFSSEII